MTVRPLRDRLLVKRIDQQEQRIGGIIIPDTATEKPQIAKVVAAGNGRVTDESGGVRATCARQPASTVGVRTPR